MTEARPVKKTRWSRGQLRFLAWVSGSAAFLSFFGILGISPKPAAANSGVAAAGRPRPVRQKIIIRKIIRRVVIVDAPKPTYSSGSYSSYTPTYTPTYSGSSGGSGTTVSAPAPAPPPPPPPVSTGGSVPPP